MFSSNSKKEKPKQRANEGSEGKPIGMGQKLTSQPIDAATDQHLKDSSAKLTPVENDNPLASMLDGLVKI